MFPSQGLIYLSNEAYITGTQTGEQRGVYHRVHIAGTHTGEKPGMYNSVYITGAHLFEQQSKCHSF